jgi:hypothetical protein
MYVGFMNLHYKQLRLYNGKRWEDNCVGYRRNGYCYILKNLLVNCPEELGISAKNMRPDSETRGRRYPE